MTATPVKSLVPVNTGTPATTEKPKRTPEQEAELKRQFLLAVNGYHVGAVDDSNLTKINEYAVQGDGIYLIVKNKIGKFVQRIHKHDFPGLPKQFDAEHKVFLNVPKIPSDIYYQIKSWFTDICTEMGDNEAFCQVYYDTHTKQYGVHVPKQEVSKAAVKYDAEDTPAVEGDPEGRYILVYECHSHNSMGAFWSGTDNADEKNTRFYGVFGELDKDVHAEKQRYIMMGKEVAITKGDIFDFENEKTVSKEEIQDLLNNKSSELIDKAEVYKLLNRKQDKVEYPEEWTEQIELPKTYGYNYNYNYNYNNNYNRGGYQGNSYRGHSGHGYGNQSSNTPVNAHGADKKNTPIAGRPTNSFPSNYGRGQAWYEEDYWDDDYEGFNFGDDNLANTYQEQSQEGQEVSEAAWLESIHDAFDLGEIEADEEAMEIAMSSFCNSIPTMYIHDLMDKLIDHGHEATCKAFWKC